MSASDWQDVPPLQYGDQQDIAPWRLALAQSLLANPIPYTNASPATAFLSGFLGRGGDVFARRTMNQYANSPQNPENRLALARLNQQNSIMDQKRREQAYKDASEAASRLAAHKKALADEKRQAEKDQLERDRRTPGTQAYKDALRWETDLAAARGSARPARVTSKEGPLRVDEDGNVVRPGKAPSAGEREKLAADLAAIAQTENIEKLFNPSFVGPLTGRVGSLQMITGKGLQKGEADFRGALAIYRNAVINALSGAAVSESEARRMKQQIPQESDPPEVFRSKLKETRDNVLRIARLRRETMSATGLDLSGLAPLPDDSGFENVGGIRERPVR